jgi:hypothetical protein
VMSMERDTWELLQAEHRAVHRYLLARLLRGAAVPEHSDLIAAHDAVAEALWQEESQQ